MNVYKHIFITATTILLFGLLISTGEAFAQEMDTIEVKQSVFVMDFSASHKKHKKAAKSFTDDFETKIIATEKYDVLPRRGYVNILRAIKIEDEIFGISRLPTDLKDSLIIKKTDAVFFGRLTLDEASGEFELEVKLQPLDLNKPVLKKAQLTFKLGIIDDNESRKLITSDMIKLLYNKEYISIKEEQLDIIEEKLSTYRARVKEVIDVYEEKIDYLLMLPENKLKPHLAEIEQKREIFNSIWNDLNNNRRKYIKNFGMHWGEASRTALKYVYSETMDDFHPKFKSYLNYLQTRINNHRMEKFRSNKKRKEAKNALAIEIKHELVKILDEDYYTDVDKKINAFLDALGEEIIEDLKEHN